MAGYAERQKIKDAQAKAAWDAMSPAMKRKMKKAGISYEPPRYDIGKRYDLDDERLNSVSSAACESTTNYSKDYSEEKPSTPDVSSEELALDAVRRVIGNLMFDGNTRLSLDCLSLATGVCFQGETETTIAKRYGITRAAVSKRCVELCKRMGIKPSSAMRSLTTRQAYARCQLKRHSRD